MSPKYGAAINSVHLSILHDKVIPMSNTNTNKKPRPYINYCEQGDLDWDPKTLEQFIFAEGTSDGLVEAKAIRSGDSFAVVRPGMERWPLGHVSDVYRPSSHRHTVDMILESAGNSVEPFGKPLCSGHGYRVVHQFSIKTDGVVPEVGGVPITSLLTVAHDHTGLNALKARMVVYAGNDALGSIVGARAIHVAENPERWRVEVENMISRSERAQEALLSLLTAAHGFVLGDADKAQLTALGVKPAGKDGWGLTLLDSMIRYYKGGAKKVPLTWGVYERRLSDTGIKAMVKVLGKKKYGQPLDAALGGTNYGGK